LEYFDFIKPRELDNLPEEPQLAFARVVEIAQPRLIDRIRDLDHNDRDGWALIQEAKYGFQGLVMGAARKYSIEPFSKSDMPLLKNYNDEDYRQFRHDLSMYITQIMLNAADADRSNSVPLIEEKRQRLRTYVFHLREAIDKSDLPDWRKDRLHKRLNDLEQELIKPRVNMTVVAGIVAAVLAVTSDAGGAYDTISKVATFILREIGQAKEADDEQKKISYDAPIALLPPRSPEAERQGRGRKTAPGSFQRDEMDDEIPF